MPVAGGDAAIQRHFEARSVTALRLAFSLNIQVVPFILVSHPSILIKHACELMKSLVLPLAFFALTLSSATCNAGVVVSQDFDTTGSNYNLLQAVNPHSGYSLPASQIRSGGPTGSYLELASRATSGAGDSTNYIVFDNASTASLSAQTLTLSFLMNGSADGMGFVLSNTSQYGTSGGTVSSLDLDTLQIEETFYSDPVGSQRTEYFNQSFHLALSTNGQDKLQLFYDGLLLYRQNVTWQNTWYDLSFTASNSGTDTILDLQITDSVNTLLSTQLTLSNVNAFNARPVLGARIGTGGDGDYLVDNIVYSETAISTVPEPSSILILGLGSAAFITIMPRRRNREAN